MTRRPETTAPVVGVIGGGQLARMMYQAAIPLGIELRIFAADEGDAGTRVARTSTIGDWHDASALRSFAEGCDVVTFDHELVDPTTVRALEDAGVVVRPGSSTLAVAADKARQRRLCQALAIPAPPHALATSSAEAIEAVSRFGYPVVAKVSRGGFDGRGVWWLHHDDEVRSLFEALPAETVVIIEPALAIDAELATLVARHPDGTMVHYPVVRTHQVDGICVSLEAPADIPPHLEAQARAWAASIADAVGAVGILAVEYFVIAGHLFVNELAPRPHNSGHYSIDACITSQFENHLRAVLGWPLGSADLQVDAAAMANLIGFPLDGAAVEHLVADPRAKVHVYEKADRPGRKVGHLTMCGINRAELHDRVRSLAAECVRAGVA